MSSTKPPCWPTAGLISRSRRSRIAHLRSPSDGRESKYVRGDDRGSGPDVPANDVPDAQSRPVDLVRRRDRDGVVGDEDRLDPRDGEQLRRERGVPSGHGRPEVGGVGRQEGPIHDERAAIAAARGLARDLDFVHSAPSIASAAIDGPGGLGHNAPFFGEQRRDDAANQPPGHEAQRARRNGRQDRRIRQRAQEGRHRGRRDHRRPGRDRRRHLRVPGLGRAFGRPESLARAGRALDASEIRAARRCEDLRDRGRAPGRSGQLPPQGGLARIDGPGARRSGSSSRRTEPRSRPRRSRPSRRPRARASPKPPRPPRSMPPSCWLRRASPPMPSNG